MITLPEYKVMGEDGHEYGPVSAEQIRQWVAERRLERKSPVMPPDAKDWVFLESLPEFAGLFLPPTLPPKKPARWKRPAVILLILLAGLAFVLLRKFKHH